MLGLIAVFTVLIIINIFVYRDFQRLKELVEQSDKEVMIQTIMKENNIPVGVDPNKKHIFDEMGIEVKTLDE